MIAVLIASSIRGTMPLLVQQLSRAGVEVLLQSLDDLPMTHALSTIGKRIDIIRKYAEILSGHDGILFCDAFDVTFYGSREDLIGRIPCRYVLQAAEKNCHPPECKALNIPDCGPWRYANGGACIGKPEAFMRWAGKCEAHPAYRPDLIDQQFMNMCVAYGYDCAWEIDSRTDTFFCLYGGYDELEFKHGQPVNRVYGTSPILLHANGQWSSDAMFENYRQSLEAA